VESLVLYSLNKKNNKYGVSLAQRDLACDWQIQSEQVSYDTDNKESQDTIVSFHDAEIGNKVDMTTAPIEETFTYSESDLKNFLSRPVLISSLTWSMGSVMSLGIDPWQMYFNKTSIKKKIDNYYLFRGNLKLKFVINASPFFYGSALVSYRPMINYDPAPIRVSGAAQSWDYVLKSQRPHVWLYPQNNQGATMTLPFLWHKEWLDLTSNQDLLDMGRLQVESVVPLLNANGVTTASVNISCYAWCENVEISGPTVGLALQAKKDEYGDGVISAPASAIARAAGELTSIPLIAPFATATQVGASAVSKIARLFGFTNPPNLNNVDLITPSPFPHCATTDISTGIEKLSIDPKNELTIDSRISGCDLKDELNIVNFAGKESYLGYFRWTSADIPESLIFNCAVTPRVLETEVIGASTHIYGTPMWLVSRMFSYWRGDIVYRFKVIASQYHRGRLRISWDPDGSISSTTESTTEVFTKIVDIAEVNDFTVRIPYMQDTAYLQTGTSTAPRQAYRLASTISGSNPTPLTRISGFENGVLTVRVLNEQTSPVDSADIWVMVSCYAADNIEFSQYSEPDPDYRFSPYVIQSDTYSYEESDTIDTNIAVKPLPESKHINLLYQGEHITSLRQVLRRFSYGASVPVANIVSTDNFVMSMNQIPRRPMYPGYDTNGYNVADSLLVPGTAKWYNWVRFHPIAFLSQCFVGERGSINMRCNLHSATYCNSFYVERGDTTSDISSYGLSRFNYRATSNGGASTGINVVLRNSAAFRWNSPGGLSLTNTRTNTGLSVNLPMYNIYKFLSTASSIRSQGSTVDLSKHDTVRIFAEFQPTQKAVIEGSGLNAGNKIDVYYAIGPDYSLLFFLNVPSLVRYSNTPSASEGTPA